MADRTVHTRSSPRRAAAKALEAFSMLWDTKFQFTLLIVSSFSSKLLHLYSHRISLPILLSLLYLPTFLLPDAILVFLTKTILFRVDKARFEVLRKIVGALLTFITAAASACQVSFYLETGGEVQWLAAGNFANDPAGMKLLMSGFPRFALALVCFIGVSWLLTPRYYDFVDTIFGSIASAFKALRGTVFKKNTGYTKVSHYSEDEDESAEEGVVDEKLVAPSKRRIFLTVVAVLAAIGTCGILQSVRPTTQPYAHMSGSLPFTLFGSLLFNARNSEFCLPRPPTPVAFPFEHVLANASWEQPDGDFPGWMPQSANCIARNGTDNLKFYDPSCDPLRISNLDQDILGGLGDVFGNEAKRPSIKHVVVLTLESTRKDIFPFKKDSRIHDIIRKSWTRFNDMHELDKKLFEMTPIASLLTGESMGFDDMALDEVHGAAPTKWTDRFNESFGGINVQAAYTGAGYTFKSLVGSQCGVEPLPVDFTEEVKGHIYQPCIPHILDLFNKQQDNKATPKGQKGETEKDYLSSPWESVIVQSITDQFDSQDILDDHMGFRKSIMKSTLLNSSSKYYPPKQPESNYFGFPETEVLPYMRDLFTEAEANNKRLFLSHVTSSTHHPYSTPEQWGKDEDYMARNRWGSEDSFNAYLNTVKYQDEWIYTIFNMLEEVGVLDETLVVLVGDHGMTFDTTDDSTSTFENGHISNFRVPLLFVHPNLPRIQLTAKTTSISIIPTLLDLLIQTHSLDAPATQTAQHLIQQYQGQSLIRTFVPEKDGRQLWYFGVINPGGSVMVISSAVTSYRLVFPLCSSSMLRFTDVAKDPAEELPIEEWSIEKLVQKVKKNMEGEDGEMAAEWIQKAEMLGRWWFWEQRERWDYHLAAKGTDRSAKDALGGGTRKKHWWETR